MTRVVTCVLESAASLASPKSETWHCWRGEIRRKKKEYRITLKCLAMEVIHQVIAYLSFEVVIQ